jgi:hypothetical protein
VDLASTTASVTAMGRRAIAWLLGDRLAAPALIALALAVIAVGARLVLLFHGHVGDMMLVGDVYGHVRHVPHDVRVWPYTGYDGQFYYRLALDPFDLRRTAFGITLDSWYRLTRIGYPALAWLLSGGQHAAVPYALVAINVLALATLGLLGGMFARDAGRNALWGLLVVGFYGFMTSLARDLTEPLGAVCLLAGLLALRRHRPILAALLLAFGSLTLEVVIVAPVALATVRLVQIARRRARPGTEDLAWIVPGVVFVAWEVVVKGATGTFPILSDLSSNAGPPLSAALRAIAHNFAHPTAPVPGAPAAVLIWDIEFVVLALFAIGALLSLRETTAPLHERGAFLLYLVMMYSLSPANWDGYADLRSFAEVYLLAVLILLAAPRRWLAGYAFSTFPLVLLIAGYRARIL